MHLQTSDLRNHVIYYVMARVRLRAGFAPNLRCSVCLQVRCPLFFLFYLRVFLLEDRTCATEVASSARLAASQVSKMGSTCCLPPVGDRIPAP